MPPPVTDLPPATDADRRVLYRLRRGYLVALSLVAIAVVIAHFLAESTLESQRGDAEVVNVSGRQRMLSQRIVKLSLLRAADSLPAPTEVDTLVAEWRERHRWLTEHVDDPRAAAALLALDPAVDSLAQLVAARPETAAELRRLDDLGDDFLRRMDATVGLLSGLSEGKVDYALRVGRWLSLVTLALLGLEVAFLFRPLVRFTAEQLTRVRERRAAEVEARERAEEAVRQKDASLRELNALTAAIDQAALFATLRQDGTVVQVSRRFQRLLGRTGSAAGKSFAALLHPEETQRAELARLFAETRAADYQGEIEVVDADGETHHLQIVVVPARRIGLDAELFVLASEVTAERHARAELDALNASRLAEEIERGRTRSRQILEVQEKERLRVARDLHDGIGQQLTALKFGLEGLRVGEEGSREAERLQQLRALCKDLIRGVRIATFNLSPPELADYGLAPALEKMASELSRLTGERIVFRNADAYAERMGSTAEVNLYRVTQEAVNNAIKYARANYILVTLSVGEALLSINVDDDGRGFDPHDEAHADEGSGLGLAFMRERVADLGGRLFVRSEVGEGTRVTINVPLTS